MIAAIMNRHVSFGFFLALVFLGQAAGGDTHYVNIANPSPASPFTSWPDAATDLQQAIDQASAGDTVLVTNGTYVLGSQILLTNGIAVRSVNGPLVTAVRQAAGARVFYLNGATGIVLEGFSITGGNLNDYGAGIFVDGTNGPLGSTEASILNCIVSNNTAQGSSGGGIASGYGAVTLVRNCLVVGNYGGHVSGISGRGGNGRLLIDNTTVTRNDAPGSQPAVYSEHGASTFGTNCIVYDNRSASGDGANIVLGNWAYTCSSPVMSGSGNINDDPLFEDAGAGYGTGHSGGDYRLKSVSPCINTGTNAGWMSGASDIRGTNRILYGSVDLGAYENVLGPLACQFSASPLNALEPADVVFTARAGGTNTTSLAYRWDFNGDGTYDTSWLTTSVVTQSLNAGAYTVVLQVTNAVGETVNKTNSNYVLISPPTVYVSLTGGNTPPYSNWATAANSLQAAANQAAPTGATILVAGGTYNLGATLTIAKGLTLRSVNGPTNTIIRAQAAGYRPLLISGASGWLLDGFTIRDASNGEIGGGIYITASITGSIVNCIIRNNTTTGTGGGIASHADVTMRNCLIAHNSSVWHSGGFAGRSGPGKHTIENCTFASFVNAGTAPSRSLT